MNNYIPSEIEGLIAATSKLKDALVSVQNDLASQVNALRYYKCKNSRS